MSKPSQPTHFLTKFIYYTTTNVSQRSIFEKWLLVQDFLEAGCPSCHPTSSVKALKRSSFTIVRYTKWRISVYDCLWVCMLLCKLFAFKPQNYQTTELPNMYNTHHHEGILYTVWTVSMQGNSRYSPFNQSGECHTSDSVSEKLCT